MKDEHELPFFAQLREAYEHLADNEPLPLVILELYLRGRLSDQGRKNVEARLESHPEERVALEDLKSILDHESQASQALRNAVQESPIRSPETPGIGDQPMDSAPAGSTPQVTLNGRALSDPSLQEILPGRRYRLRPVEACGRYTVCVGNRVTILDVDSQDLATAETPSEVSRAAESDSEAKGTGAVKRSQSSDADLQVELYPAVRRSDGSILPARFEIYVR